MTKQWRWWNKECTDDHASEFTREYHHHEIRINGIYWQRIMLALLAVQSRMKNTMKVALKDHEIIDKQRSAHVGL